MRIFWAIFLVRFVSLSAVDIPLDGQLKSFSLKKGIELWLKEHLTDPRLGKGGVACRYVGQDPIQGKPQIFDLDCSADAFEEEFPSFLDYCDEEIQRKGGASLGIVAVGTVDPEGLYQYLSHRYDQSEMGNAISEEAIQLIPHNVSHETEVLLSYPINLLPVQSQEDLKKLWVFYLVQSMAENRFKKASVAAEGKWVSPDEVKSLLPFSITVGHGVEKMQTGEDFQGKLLKSFLSAIQILKAGGFTENELADSKSQLLKHLKQFYEPNPSEKTLADYYASHLAASLPCTDYSTFMQLSFHTIPEIGMDDIAEMLNASFKDDTRQVIIRYPKGIQLSRDHIQTMLIQFQSDDIECKYETDKIIIVEGKDPFSQLPITNEEQKMIRGVLQTVAETNPIKLGFMASELEKKSEELLHIHPLRSMATLLTDPYTKQCLAEVADSFFKWRSFINKYTKRLHQEAERGNLLMHIPGFCIAVKANPEIVRAYIHNKEYEKLVKYLIKLN